MMTIDKIGSFYLGKIINPITEKVTDDLFYYNSKNLTTHAVCVGMTGSGKTGLGIAVLEEAALSKIPAIIIDPKGDLSNLLLTFPDLSAKEFLPWIDHEEAEKQGISDEAYAKAQAKTWEEGLQSSFENEQRIKKLRDSCDMVIYTPASNAGISLSILSSFKAPPAALRADKEFMRERVLTLTSSLLGLLGIEADPIKSREHILISTIIDQAFEKGKDLDIASLIREIQAPSFDKLGALDIETFFPQKERLNLAIRLNGLLASKSFQAWTEGEPLQIQDLLFTKENKPKLSIISIAHLSDSERMFFVTLLLGEFIGWMRRQPGTSLLKTILYMDEVFGFFPPTAMPPSKLPMLTLLKTARAFGVGIFLSTQNPADLDYKGLANCGTWFIGKLQTERDKSRVLEGLKVASNGEISTDTLDKMMSAVKKRTFIMRSIHEKEPIIFETRWTMSYLKGPLTLPQIALLTGKKEAEEPKSPTDAALQVRPLLPKNISEYFFRPSTITTESYKPFVLASANLHFVDAKNKIDCWKNIFLLFPIDPVGKNISLAESKEVPDIKRQLETIPIQNAAFEDLPATLLQEKNLGLFQKALSASLYQNQSLTLFEFKNLGMLSKPDESKSDFQARVASMLKEANAQEIQKCRDKYSEKIALISNKIKRTDDKMTVQKQQSFMQTIETILSFFSTIFTAFLGKKINKTTINQFGTSMRRASRMTKESGQVSEIEESLKSYEAQIEDLKDQQEDEIKNIELSVDEKLKSIEEVIVKPRKSDIAINEISLIWSQEDIAKL